MDLEKIKIYFMISRWIFENKWFNNTKIKTSKINRLNQNHRFFQIYGKRKKNRLSNINALIPHVGLGFLNHIMKRE